MGVFFYRKHVSTDGQRCSIIVTDKPLTSQTVEVNGVKVKVRVQTSVTFGVLAIRDNKNDKPAGPNSPEAKAFDSFNQGDPMGGFKLSSQRILNQDGTETDMYWVTGA